VTGGETGERTNEFVLAVAFDAGESDDLAGNDLQRDALQDFIANVTGCQQRYGASILRCLVREDPVHRTTDDQRQNIFFRHARGVEGAVKTAVP